MDSVPPHVIVLAGPNGAGKTTAARTLLAETLQLYTFVNADVIAQGLSGFAPERSAVEAGKIMLNRLHDLAEQRENFAFETTLAGRYYAQWLPTLQQSGYIIHLIFFWLSSPELAVSRVAERVRLGGHDIPEATIRQRYTRSVRNFLKLYCPRVDTWKLYNNSDPYKPELIAHKLEDDQLHVLNPGVWQSIQTVQVE